MMVKKFVFLAFILCCSVFAQDNPSTQDNSTQDKSSTIQALEAKKQNNEWRKIKGSFPNQNEFFNIAEQGFRTYYRKYSPQVVSRSDENLIMAANYGKHHVKCIFFIDASSQYIVILETDFDRDRIKWINNVVKQVETLGK